MVKKQVLILTSVASMIDQFLIPNIELLIDMGYKVQVACNFKEGNTCSDEQINILKDKLNKLNVQYHQIEFKRNIKKLKENKRAYNKVYNLMKKNNYEFVHCHSPIGGVCGRIAGKKTNTKVIYTVHGFHFYKGAPILNWLLFYPVEKILSKYTDVIITINTEDFNRALKFRAKQVECINGVGIDIKKFNNCSVNIEETKKNLGIPEDGFVVLSVGELNKNKNHKVIIKAIAKIDNPNIYYVVCGQGNQYNYLVELSSKLCVSKKIKLLGFRNDISNIYKIADLFVFPSKREGLGLAALEAMANGLPIITSDVHGINDYSENDVTGYKCNPSDYKKFAKYIQRLYDSPNDRIRIGNTNIEKVKKYDVFDINSKMRKIYSEI